MLNRQKSKPNQHQMATTPMLSIWESPSETDQSHHDMTSFEESFLATSTSTSGIHHHHSTHEAEDVLADQPHPQPKLVTFFDSLPSEILQRIARFLISGDGDIGSELLAFSEVSFHCQQSLNLDSLWLKVLPMGCPKGISPQRMFREMRRIDMAQKANESFNSSFQSTIDRFRRQLGSSTTSPNSSYHATPTHQRRHRLSYVPVNDSDAVSPQHNLSIMSPPFGMEYTPSLMPHSPLNLQTTTSTMTAKSKAMTTLHVPDKTPSHAHKTCTSQPGTTTTTTVFEDIVTPNPKKTPSSKSKSKSKSKSASRTTPSSSSKIKRKHKQKLKLRNSNDLDLRHRL